MLEYAEYVLVDHFRLALHAALLFAAGLFVAWPVVRYRLHGVAWLPRKIMRFVTVLMGPRPSIFRITLVIFLFNSTVIFIQMASGFHPFLPKLLGLWTGMNVAIMASMADPEDMPALSSVPPDGWVPPSALTIICGLTVLVLELPCYWFALAMGMRMGHEVQEGAIYSSVLAERARVYALLIVPALLASAAAEAVSIRGSGARLQQQDSGEAE